MLTLAELLRSTQKLRNKVNPTALFRVLEIAPIPLANALAVKTRFNALTDESMEFYDTIIVFHGLSFSPKKDFDHPLGAEIVPGVFVYMQRPQFNRTPVGVTCMCKHYYYVAWYYNMKNGVHSGPDMPPYIRRTPPPPIGYPYANALRVPFACKHLIRTVKHLADKRFLVS